MTERRALPTGIAPRLLSRAAAAAYCGVSTTRFTQSVDVAPLTGFGARKLWDLRALDRWLDRRSGLESAPQPTGRSIAERLNGTAAEGLGGGAESVRG